MHLLQCLGFHMRRVAHLCITTSRLFFIIYSFRLNFGSAVLFGSSKVMGKEDTYGGET